MTSALADQKVRQYKDQAGRLSETLPETASAYHQWTGECFASGELDAKTKHLIALAVAMYANNEVCTFYHMEEARSEGASDRQIMETAAVAAAAASGHVLSQGVVRVQGTLRPEAAGFAGIPAGGMQDYLQDTEFSADWDLNHEAPGAPGATHEVSPSY